MKKTLIIVLLLALSLTLAVGASAEEKTVVYHTELDFNDISDTGSFTEYKGFGKDWKAVQATQYETHGENGSLRFAPFAELVCQRQLTGPYVFSSDVKSPGSQFFGIFVRTTGEYLSGVSFFEHDGIKTSSGDADNEGIGATGIYVMPRGKKIMLCIKTADGNQPKGIGTDKTVIETGVDMSGDFAKLTFEDDGKEIKILVADKLICTVKMSELSEFDFMSAYKLYTKADIYDADGNSIKTVLNCRISADFSTVAFGMRINGANIDNVSITEYEKEPEETKAPLGIRRVDIKTQPEKYQYLIGEPLDLSDMFLEITYDNGVKEDVKITADMIEGFDNETTGVKLLTVNYGKKSAAYSIKVVTEYESETETERETIDFDTSPETTKAEQSTGGKTKTIIIIVAIVAAVAVCAVLIVLLTKGKKPDDEKL